MTAIAAMTAFYMFRLYFGIFWGTENKQLHAEHTPHEAPLTMTFPLMFLAVVTCVAGFIPFGHFVSADGQAYDIHLDWNVAGTSIVIAVGAIALATYIYMGERQPVAEAAAESFRSSIVGPTSVSIWTRFTNTSPTASSLRTSPSPLPGLTATLSTDSSTSSLLVPMRSASASAVCKAVLCRSMLTYSSSAFLSCWPSWYWLPFKNNSNRRNKWKIYYSYHHSYSSPC